MSDVYGSLDSAAAAILARDDPATLLDPQEEAKILNKQGIVLHQAVIFSNPGTLADLLKGSQGKHVNYQDKQGRTALYAACVAETHETDESIECVRLLLEAGANPNIVTSQKLHCRAPLHLAANTNKLQTIILLVNYGANLQMKDSFNLTAVEYAKKSGDVEIVEFLTTKEDEQKLLCAELEQDLLGACSDVHHLHKLLQKVGFSAINAEYAETLLYRATELNKEDVVQWLIENGANGLPNKDTKETALYIACQRGYVALARKLLQNYPWQAGQKTTDNELPLHAAANMGHANLVQLLLNFDYKLPISNQSSVKQTLHEGLPFFINQRNLSGQTPLYLACASGHANVVKELLDYQPKVARVVLPNGQIKPAFQIDTYTIEGKTPLHCAVLSGNEEIVALLLKKGADVNLQVKSIQCLFGSTKHKKMEKFKKRLFISGSDSSILYAAFQKEEYNLEIFKMLLNHGAKDTDGQVLISASLSVHQEVLSLLLAYTGVTPDQDMEINPEYRDRFQELFKTHANYKGSVNSRKQSPKTSPDSTLMTKQNATIERKKGVLSRRKTGLSFRRSYNTYSSFDTPVRINWHDQNLSDIKSDWLVQSSWRFNPALKQLPGSDMRDALATITSIDISDNSLRYLPVVLFCMPSLQSLNVTKNKLQMLPSFSSRFQRSVSEPTGEGNEWNAPLLQNLMLDHNRLSLVPVDVFKLPSLELLSLRDNAIKSLPFEMWRAPNLKILNLSRNKLKELPHSPTELDDELSADEDCFESSSTCSSSSGGSVRLDSISTATRSSGVSPQSSPSHRPLSEFTEGGSNLVYTSFKRHRLCSTGSNTTSNVEDEQVPGEEIFSLQELDLSHNALLEIPTGLACLAPQLRKLVLSNNSIHECGPINRLPVGLVDLDVSHNCICKVTNSTRRASIQGKHNMFMRFWSGHGDGSSTHNDHCYSPFFLLHGMLPPSRSSKESVSSTSPKKSLSPRVGFGLHCKHQKHRMLSNLRTLNLSHNDLVNVPIVATVILDMVMETNPEEEQQDEDHSRKQHKNSHGNSSPQLLKSEVSLLFPSLNCLSLSHNFLSEIPADIEYLSKLNSLDVSHNPKIVDLPPEMGRLSSLYNLKYEGCSIKEEEFSGMLVKDIVAYLRSILDDAQPYLRMKLMFVGRSGIGKTTLLNEIRKEATPSSSHIYPEILSFAERQGNQYIGGKTLKGDHLSTVGVDVGEWSYSKRKGHGKVTFSTWDFGGQSEFYATHQYFLTKRSIYLVIFKIPDSRSCISQLQQWLVNIQARAPNSPCILVGTHYDVIKSNQFSPDYWPELKKAIEDRFIRIETQQDVGLPDVRCCVEVSSLSGSRGSNISHLREKIYEVAFSITTDTRDRKTVLLQPVPTSYLALEKAVKHILGNLKQENREPVLSAIEYKTEVARVMLEQSEISFHNNEELLLATKFLHNNGVLLHYEDAQLSDYFFMDPQWLCDTLAKVVTIHEINPDVKKGIMLIRDLEQKFENSTVRVFIRSLLNKFEVAVTYDSKHLLIPSMLPNEADAISILMNRERVDPLSEEKISSKQRCQSLSPGVRSHSLSSSRRLTPPRSPGSKSANTSPVHGGSQWHRRAIKGSTSPFKKRPKSPASCQLEANNEEALAQSTNQSGSSGSLEISQICTTTVPPLAASIPVLRNSKESLENNSDWTKLNPIDISLVSAPDEIDPVLPKALDKFIVTTRGRHNIPLRRLYVLQYIPSGFWSHIVSRFLSDQTLPSLATSIFDVSGVVREFLGEEAVSELCDQYEWQCWQTGLELRFLNVKVLHVKQILSESLLSTNFDKERRPDVIKMINISNNLDLGAPTVPLARNGQVEILIPTQPIQITNTEEDTGSRTIHFYRSTEALSRLLSNIMDLIENLIENFYPSLCEPLGVTYTGELFITRIIPCYRCWRAYSRDGGEAVDVQDWEFINHSDSDVQISNQQDLFLHALLGNSYDKALQKGSICCALPCTPQKIRNSFGPADFGIFSHSRHSKKNPKQLLTISTPSTAHTETLTLLQSHSLLAASSLNVDSIQASLKEDYFSSTDEVINNSNLCVYGFLLEELIREGMRSETVSCPDHGKLSLEKLAPDAVFHDLGKSLLVEDEKLVKKKLLGSGSFGLVFEGIVNRDDNNIPVALKMIQPYPPGEGARKTDRLRYEQENSKWQRNPVRCSCEAYRTVRKELSILLNLKHASIVPLMGLCRHPLCLILELAPKGALDKHLEDYKRGGARLMPTTVCKVVVQISCAVSYLHSKGIIYRDLKAENVLVWRFPEPHSLTTDVKVKLADYGISVTALPSGTKGYGGTPGYMAPEIVKYDGKETYTEKVDCFSLGMFLYELLSLQHPFESVIGRDVGRLAEVIKQLIKDGQRPALSRKEKSFPTYIVDLVMWCWCKDPKDRPSMQQIHQLARSVEFASLIEIFSFEEEVEVTDTSVLSFASDHSGRACTVHPSVFCFTQIDRENTSSKLTLFPLENLPGDDSTMIQISLPSVTAECLCAVGETIWLATSTGYIKVFLFSGETFQEVHGFHHHQSHSKSRKVVRMLHIPALKMVVIAAESVLILHKEEQGYPLDGSGSFQIVEMEHDITTLGVTSHPSLDNRRSFKLWCGQHEGQMVAVDVSNLSKPASRVSDPSGKYVTCMATDQTSFSDPVSVWTSVFLDTTVYRWNAVTEEIEGKFDVMADQMCKPFDQVTLQVNKRPSRPLSGFHSRISALCVLNQILYAGINSGKVLLIKANAMIHLQSISCHEGPVDHIISVASDVASSLLDISQTGSLESNVSQPKPLTTLITLGKGFGDIIGGCDNSPTRLQSSESQGTFMLLWNPQNLEKYLEPDREEE